MFAIVLDIRYSYKQDVIHLSETEEGNAIAKFQAMKADRKVTDHYHVISLVKRNENGAIKLSNTIGRWDVVAGDKHPRWSIPAK